MFPGFMLYAQTYMIEVMAVERVSAWYLKQHYQKRVETTFSVITSPLIRSSLTLYPRASSKPILFIFTYNLDQIVQ